MGGEVGKCGVGYLVEDDKPLHGLVGVVGGCDGHGTRSLPLHFGKDVVDGDITDLVAIDDHGEKLARLIDFDGPVSPPARSGANLDLSILEVDDPIDWDIG
jgi:hypothetical protein